MKISKATTITLTLPVIIGSASFNFELVFHHIPAFGSISRTLRLKKANFFVGC